MKEKLPRSRSVVVLPMINKNTNSIYKASQPPLCPLILQPKPKAAGKVQAAALGAGLQSFLRHWALPVLRSVGLNGLGPEMGFHVKFNRWMMKCRFLIYFVIDFLKIFMISACCE